MRSLRLIQNAAPSATPRENRPCIFNRFALSPDGLIHLAPFGDHPHKNGLQRFDRAAGEAILAAYNAAGRPELLIDFDHESHDNDKSTEAAGWIANLELRADGLWAKPRWSDTGEAAVRNGRFRYTSPVWACDEAPGGILVPIELIDVALTNKPNLKNLKPISNRKTENNQHSTTATMDKIKKALGLPETATDEEILAAIEALTGDKAALETEVAANREVEALALCDKHGISDEAKRTELKTLYLANRDAAKKIFSLLPEKPVTAAPAKSVPLTNRAAPKNPENPAGAAADADDAKASRHAAKLRNRALEIQKTCGVKNYNKAWAMAQAELGEGT